MGQCSFLHSFCSFSALREFKIEKIGCAKLIFLNMFIFHSCACKYAYSNTKHAYYLFCRLVLRVSQLSWLERTANNRKVRGSSPRGTILDPATASGKPCRCLNSRRYIFGCIHIHELYNLQHQIHTQKNSVGLIYSCRCPVGCYSGQRHFGRVVKASAC